MTRTNSNSTSDCVNKCESPDLWGPLFIYQFIFNFHDMSCLRILLNFDLFFHFSTFTLCFFRFSLPHLFFSHYSLSNLSPSHFSPSHFPPPTFPLLTFPLLTFPLPTFPLPTFPLPTFPLPTFPFCFLPSPFYIKWYFY